MIFLFLIKTQININTNIVNETIVNFKTNLFFILSFPNICHFCDYLYVKQIIQSLKCRQNDLKRFNTFI